MLPFTREQFLANFVFYNEAVWPVQVLAWLLGFLMTGLLVRRSPAADRIVSAGLACMWLWTGIVYYALYFSEINRAALAFGLLFVVQALLLLYAGAVRNSLHFAPPSDLLAWPGAGLIAYSGILYPLIGLATEHGFRALPAFGVTPCPVTLFTLGMLLLTCSRVPRWLLAVPLVWSLIGGTAAFLLGIVQDWLLLIGGPLAVALIIVRDWRPRSGARPGETQP